MPSDDNFTIFLSRSSYFGYKGSETTAIYVENCSPEIDLKNHFFGKNRNFLHKGLRNKSKGRKPCVKKGLWGISCMKYTLTLFRHPWWITYILNTAINEINRCLHLAESFTYDETQPSLQVTVENGITLTKTKKKSKKNVWTCCHNSNSVKTILIPKT